jgi:hypothetical protein
MTADSSKYVIYLTKFWHPVPRAIFAAVKTGSTVRLAGDARSNKTPVKERKL